MNSETTISIEIFTKRLADLCAKSNLSGLPKSVTDQHILMKSAILSMGSPGSLTEKEVDEWLKHWINDIAQIKLLDHITVRRWLIDHGYLERTPDGSRYQIPKTRLTPPHYDPTVEQVDPAKVLTGARMEIERRKQEYLSKSKK